MSKEFSNGSFFEGKKKVDKMTSTQGRLKSRSGRSMKTGARRVPVALNQQNHMWTVLIGISEENMSQCLCDLTL